MNIIFLDIDGVLTSRNSNSFIFECDGDDYKLNDYNVQCLKHILDNVDDCKIVLSTSWRNYPDNHIFIGQNNGETYKSLLPNVKSIFDKYIIGMAPHKSIYNRKYDDICDYLSTSNCKDFVVLDDDGSQGLEGFGDQFFKINRNEGLTLIDANVIVKYFK